MRGELENSRKKERGRERLKPQRRVKNLGHSDKCARGVIGKNRAPDARAWMRKKKAKGEGIKMGKREGRVKKKSSAGERSLKE